MRNDRAPRHRAPSAPCTRPRRPTDRAPNTLAPPTRTDAPRRRSAPTPPHTHGPCPCPRARRPPGPGWGSPVGVFAFTSPYVWTKFFFGSWRFRGGAFLLVVHRWLWICLGVVPVASGLGLLVPRVSSCLGLVFLPPSLSLSWVALRTFVLAPHCLWSGRLGPFPPKLIRGSTRQIRRHYQKALSMQHTSHLPDRQGPDRSSRATSVVLGSQDVSPVIPGWGAATDSVTARSSDCLLALRNPMCAHSQLVAGVDGSKDTPEAVWVSSIFLEK